MDLICKDQKLKYCKYSITFVYILGVMRFIIFFSFKPYIIRGILASMISRHYSFFCFLLFTFLLLSTTIFSVLKIPIPAIKVQAQDDNSSNPNSNSNDQQSSSSNQPPSSNPNSNSND